MVNKRYTLLEKHFLQKTSAEEEKQIDKFKMEDEQEYLLLKNLWYSHAKIYVKDFDSKAAWKKIITKTLKPSSIYFKSKRVAAIALVLLISGLFAYFLNQKINRSSLLIETSNLSSQTDTILLADGTTVWLSRNSRLSYPKKFRGRTREVHLDGEAFFEVVKNPKKPFSVSTRHAVVTVLGTAFNVNSDSLQSIVSVVSGKVNVQSEYSGSGVTVLPGFMASVTPDGLEKSQITNPNYLSWKTGVFLFEDTPLPDVIKELNRYYPKPVKLNTVQQNRLFTAHFEQAQQGDILEILKITFNLNICENTNFYEIR